MPTPTKPPDVAKYAEPDEESAVVLAYVAVRYVAVKREPSKVRSESSVNAPAVVMYGTRPEVSEETVRFVLEAVPKYPVPETESAVVLAYGNTDAVVEVAKYLAAVGVELATSAPVLSVVRIMFVPIPVNDSVPVAVMLPAVRFPEMRALPCTLNARLGLVVPIPTFPPKNCAA